LSAAEPIDVRQTREFVNWFESLRDQRAKARIVARVRRLSLGNFGDVKPLGEGVSELRIDYGPGYRIYVAPRGPKLVLLLAGGDKSRQRADIERARQLLAALESE
jgi:putative addiction module killer protein